MIRKKALDLASLLTLAITLILFVTAAAIHGLSSELLLEAGVFLISVKLVLSARKSEILVEEVQNQLAEIDRKVSELSARTK